MTQKLVPVYAVATGVLMAAFQLLRPWGDVAGETDPMIGAFADPRWVVAHLAGAASFVTLALLADAVVRASFDGRRAPAVARFTRLGAAVGAALILPYYGAETFALHEIGLAAQAGAAIDVVVLSDSIRMNAAAVVLFGAGLLLVAAVGICLAIVAARVGAARWGTWPLGMLAALALPQFALPPAGRMAYGVAFFVAGVLFAIAWSRRHLDEGGTSDIAR